MAFGSPQWMYASGDFTLDQSLRFNDGDSPYLNWTPSSAGNRKTWTWSGWVKRGNLGAWQMMFSAGVDATHRTYLAFDDTDKLKFNDYDTSAANFYFTSPGVYRDTGAWYHIVAAVDTTQGTQSNRVKVYVNGEQVAMVLDAGSQTQNHTTFVNNNAIHALSRASHSSAEYFDGYLGEVHFIDGTQLTPTSFGETGDYGEWKPIAYSGSYGTNGFYLPFKQDYTVEGFSTVTYKGTGASQYIGGVGFKPDLVWTKVRTAGSAHALFDSVRGVHKALYSNLTTAEETSSSTFLQSFESDGFDPGSNGSTAASGESYVAWNWDMGGSNATNTDGSITSTVRANPTYGQSIVSATYSGSGTKTFGHGLSSAPELIIGKNRSAVANWGVYNSTIGAGKYLLLDTTGAEVASTTIWSNTAPTSTVFSSDVGWLADAGNDVIFYCFHSVDGYSKVGSYEGNDKADGTFVYTGFRPAWVMVKRTDNAENWVLYDNLRAGYNADNDYVLPNSSATEYTGYKTIDLTSNGFKLRTTHSDKNASGTYIYLAFAETPFKYSNAR